MGPCRGPPGRSNQALLENADAVQGFNVLDQLRRVTRRLHCGSPTALGRTHSLLSGAGSVTGPRSAGKGGTLDAMSNVSGMNVAAHVMSQLSQS